MSAKELKILNGLKTRISKSLEIISIERDKMREYLSQVEDIVDDVDAAATALDDAKDLLEQAIDGISQSL